MTEIQNNKYIDSKACKILYWVGVLPFLMLLACAIVILQEPEMHMLRAVVLFIPLALAFYYIAKRFFLADKNKKLNFVSITAAFFCTYGCRLYIQGGKSLIWLLLYGFILLFLRISLEKVMQRKVIAASTILGVLFAVFVFLGEQLKRTGSLEIVYFGNDLFELTMRFVYLSGQIFLFSIVLSAVFSYILEKDFSDNTRTNNSMKAELIELLIMLLGIIILWLPYYYAYYPGILTIDSFAELKQCLGMRELSNHHPYIHQLLIGACLKLGGNSLESGVAIYSAIQMFVLALCFSICVLFLKKMGVHKTICVVVYGFFALFPVNPLYGITMWKDVVHGIVCLLLMMTMVLEVSKEGKEDPHKKIRFLMLVLLLFFFSTFRNNGWYAFILGFPFVIICNRKMWKRLLCVFLIAAMMVSGYHHLLFDVLGINKSRAAESLSVPLQQIARVAHYGEVLESEEGQVLREVFPEFESLDEKYDPGLSDNVKDAFISEKFTENPWRYIKAWASLGIKYPVTYIEAFLMQCYGYWYPDVTYWIASDMVLPNDLGLENIEGRDYLRNKMNEFYSRFSKYEPTAILFSLGLMVWLILIAGVLLCLKGQGKLASPLWLMATFWLTTLASPVYCEYRYLYGLVVSVPLFLGLALGIKKKSE